MKLTADYCKVRTARPRKAYTNEDYERVEGWINTVNEGAVANYVSQITSADTLALLRDVLQKAGKADLVNRVEKRADILGVLLTPMWMG